MVWRARGAPGRVLKPPWSDCNFGAPAGTLWNLSSHDSIKMAIVDNALHALTDEVVIPRSGWEREPNEDSKPRHIEWESVLTNTAGCLRYGLLEESWCGLGCCKAPPQQSHTAKGEQPCSPQRSCSPGTAAGGAALNFGGVPLGGEKPGGLELCWGCAAPLP